MYQEKFKGDRKNRVYYDVRPMMAEETWANMKAFFANLFGNFSVYVNCWYMLLC